jgi:tryptophan synthase
MTLTDLFLSPQMGTTGSSSGSSMSASLPELIARIRAFTPVPLAVGFGVANRTHFEAVAASGADGVVIGSRIVSVIKDAPAEQTASVLEAYCREISLKGTPRESRPIKARSLDLPVAGNGHANGAHPSAAVPPSLPIPAADPLAVEEPKALDPNHLPARFGAFGGQYVPESLVDCLAELEQAHKDALADPEFWKEFRGMYGYMNRPSELYLAERLTEHAGGAQIWMK